MLSDRQTQHLCLSEELAYPLARLTPALPQSHLAGFVVYSIDSHHNLEVGSYAERVKIPSPEQLFPDRDRCPV